MTTVATVAEDYLTHLAIERGLSVHTIAAYRRDLQRYGEYLQSQDRLTLSSVVQENTFRKITDGLYVQVASRRSGGVLHGIFVADSRNAAYELV